MILVRLNFIAVTTTIVLVGAIAWHLSATVTKHAMIEQRKMEVMEWAAQQDDLNGLLRTKYGVMLSAKRRSTAVDDYDNPPAISAGNSSGCWRMPK